MKTLHLTKKEFANLGIVLEIGKDAVSSTTMKIIDELTAPDFDPEEADLDHIQRKLNNIESNAKMLVHNLETLENALKEYAQKIFTNKMASPVALIEGVSEDTKIPVSFDDDMYYALKETLHDLARMMVEENAPVEVIANFEKTVNLVP
jgi:hypothetical protein